MSGTFNYQENLARLMENDFRDADSRYAYVIEHFVNTGHGMPSSWYSNPGRGPFYIWDDNFENCYRVGSGDISEKPEKISFDKALEGMGNLSAPDHLKKRKEIKPLSWWEKLGSVFGFKSQKMKENEQNREYNAKLDKEYLSTALIQTNADLAAKLAPDNPAVKKYQEQMKQREQKKATFRPKQPLKPWKNERSMAETIAHYRPLLESGKISADRYRNLVHNAKKADDSKLPDFETDRKAYRTATRLRYREMLKAYKTLDDPEKKMAYDVLSNVITSYDVDQMNYEAEHLDDELEIEENEIDRMHREAMQKAREKDIRLINMKFAKPKEPDSYMADFINKNRMKLARNEMTFNDYKKGFDNARVKDENRYRLEPQKMERCFRLIANAYARFGENSDSIMRTDMYDNQRKVFYDKEIDGITRGMENWNFRDVDPNLLDGINSLKAQDKNVDLSASQIRALDQDLRTMSKSQTPGIKNMAYELTHGGGKFAEIVKSYQNLDLSKNDPAQRPLMKYTAALNVKPDLGKSQLQNHIQDPQNQMQHVGP